MNEYFGEFVEYLTRAIVGYQREEFQYLGQYVADILVLLYSEKPTPSTTLYWKYWSNIMTKN